MTTSATQPERSTRVLRAILAGLGTGADAAKITRSGTTVSIRGRIEAGDELTFAAAAPQGSDRAVQLDSVGGQLSAAGPIARGVKVAGAITIYDASRSVCSSARTILFLADAQRYYLRADVIREGVGPQGRKGLGFHEAHSMDPGNSGRTMGATTALYDKAGAPAAAELSGAGRRTGMPRTCPARPRCRSGSRRA